MLLLVGVVGVVVVSPTGCDWGRQSVMQQSTVLVIRQLWRGLLNGRLMRRRRRMMMQLLMRVLLVVRRRSKRRRLTCRHCCRGRRRGIPSSSSSRLIIIIIMIHCSSYRITPSTVHIAIPLSSSTHPRNIGGGSALESIEEHSHLHLLLRGH